MPTKRLQKVRRLMSEIGLDMIETIEVQLCSDIYDSLKSSVEASLKQFDTNIWKLKQGPYVSHLLIYSIVIFE